MMDEREATETTTPEAEWKLFERTGMVSFYLAYKRAVEDEKKWKKK